VSGTTGTPVAEKGTRGEQRTGHQQEGLLARVAGSPILRLIARRLMVVIPRLFVVSILVFLLMEALPGDPARIQAGMDASEEQVEAVRLQMGLDRPGYERYLSWVGGAFTGDLGNSIINGRAVTTLLGERLPVTLQMAGMAFILSVVIALPLALAAARKPGGLVDRFVMILSMTSCLLPVRTSHCGATRRLPPMRISHLTISPMPMRKCTRRTSLPAFWWTTEATTRWERRW
jgi:peptide/nickel transport system permease protein